MTHANGILCSICLNVQILYCLIQGKHTCLLKHFLMVKTFKIFSSSLLNQFVGYSHHAMVHSRHSCSFLCLTWESLVRFSPFPLLPPLPSFKHLPFHPEINLQTPELSKRCDTCLLHQAYFNSHNDLSLIYIKLGLLP